MSKTESESRLADSLVDWDADDPANPLNWPASKRWAHIATVATPGLVTNFAPTVFAPAIDGLVADFAITSSTVSTLAITIYVLGTALGPMVASPLSEVYGRLPVYHAANVAFVAFVVGSALSTSAGQFMALRFLSGCAGGTPLALGGGTIADLTTPRRRALAATLFSIGPLTGPVLGPLVGGFVAAAKGWRWTLWVLAMVAAAAAAATLVVMRETHPKVLLERKAARLRAATGNPKLRSRLARPVTPRQVLLQSLARPVMLLLRSPVLLVMSLYVTLVFGVMYLLFSTFDAVFGGQYGFDTSTSGLVYLGLGVAAVAGTVFSAALGDRIHASKAGPERRLLTMIWFSPFVGIGLFVYGWTAYYRVHWIVPVLGTALIGFGAFFVIMPAQLYLVDLFGSEAAASALGANILLRYLGGTFLPLAGPTMYKTLQLGWGNTLLGFLALAFCPAPIFLYKYGERFR